MRRKKSSRSYLSSLYSRMSKAAQAGMRRLRGRANRAGPEHLAADAAEFDYIEREAHDILAAVARLRARDAAETMAPEAYASEPMPELALEPYALEPMPDTIADYAPEASANQARGRRRRANRAEGTRDYSYKVFPSTRVEGQGHVIPGHGKAALRAAVNYAKSLPYYGAGIYDVSQGAFAGYITASGRYRPFSYSGRVT